MTPERISLLTPRERQILILIAAGKKNREITAQLGIARTTVQAHVRSARVRLAIPVRGRRVLREIAGRLAL